MHLVGFKELVSELESKKIKQEVILEFLNETKKRTHLYGYNR